MSKFSDRLRDLRQRVNMTQKELGDALKISNSTVSMYERGEREPDFETLETIADFFNVSMSTLIDAQKETQKPEPASGEISLDEEVDQLLSGLSPASSNTLMLDGKPASPEAIAALRSALRIGVEQAREMQKERKDE